MTNPIRNLLAHYAQAKTPLLVRLRHDPAPAGPGLLEPFPAARLGDPDDEPELFTFQMPIQQDGRRGILPITFHAADVLWVSTGAVEAKPTEEPRIVLANGPMTFGGGRA